MELLLCKFVIWHRAEIKCHEKLVKVKLDAYNYTDIGNAMDNHEKLIAVLFWFCNKMSC